MVPAIAVLGTGGTIASTGGEEGATPSLSETELVESVPALEEYALLVALAQTTNPEEVRECFSTNYVTTG